MTDRAGARLLLPRLPASSARPIHLTLLLFAACILLAPTTALAAATPEGVECPRVILIPQPYWTRYLEQRELRPWYSWLHEPRGTTGPYYVEETDSWDYVVRLRADAATDLKLFAHEYGHWTGLDHPAVHSPAYWLDIMGENPWRTRDQHDLLTPATRCAQERGLID